MRTADGYLAEALGMTTWEPLARVAEISNYVMIRG